MSNAYSILGAIFLAVEILILLVFGWGALWLCLIMYVIFIIILLGSMVFRGIYHTN